MSVTEDREKIVLHRLFEDSDKKDLDKIEQIVQCYMEKYTEPIRIENPYKYKQRMAETYPFHPLLLETLTQIYEAATERQDIRGMMNVLAEMVKENYDKRDLLLICDLDERFSFSVPEGKKKRLRESFGGSRFIPMDKTDLSEFVQDGYVIDFSGYYLIKSRYVWPVPGKYNIYLHGGVSLMECLVPVIEVER